MEEINKAVKVFKSHQLMGTKIPTRSNRPHYQILFDEVNRLVGKRQKVIDWSCSSCVTAAYGVISNYVNHHHKEQPKEVGQPKEEKSNYSGMKLSELRKLFPEIKANSVKKFIKQID